jgi:chitinase
LLSSGAADQAQVWASLDDNTRSSISSAYSDAGINILVGAFGSTEAPTSSGSDPTATANTMAAWVKQYNLGGIDIDYEDFVCGPSSLMFSTDKRFRHGST